MPKNAPARKSKPRKKTKAANKEGTPNQSEFSAAVCRSFIPRLKFMEALEKSDLVDDATDVFKSYHIVKAHFLLKLGMDKQEWDARIDLAVEQFKENLPKALYSAAVITASQTSPFISKHFSEKSFIRRLAAWLFVESSEQEALLIDGRGRKSKIKTHLVYEAIFNRGADASRKSVAFDYGFQHD